MFKRKMVYKITLGYVIIVLITLCAVGIFFITGFRDYTFKTNMQARAKEIAKVAEPYLTKDSDINEYDPFFELLDSFAGSRIWVSDKNGNIVAMSSGDLRLNPGNNESNLDASAREMISKALKGENVVQEGYVTYYNEDTLSVGVPVLGEKNNIIGTVFLHSPVLSITSVVDNVFNFFIIAIILAFIMTGLLGVFYSYLITKPIKLMNNIAMEMTRGNYDVRTNIRQKDEIGELGNSLDLLASKLGYTIDQLFQERNKLNDIIASISEGILAFDVNMKLNVMLPYLMRYMGHASLKSTCYYIHFVPEFFSTFNDITKVLSDILPEVDDEATS
ncbi:MAG: HAMP domain-containing protein [Peptococcaceae bacterium]|nr:HAMP domain-containing protein [Peptococcaceae bacterium]